MTEYSIRFFVGGIVVSVFAMLGDLLSPKSVAGLFEHRAMVGATLEMLARALGRERWSQSRREKIARL